MNIAVIGGNIRQTEKRSPASYRDLAKKGLDVLGYPYFDAAIPTRSTTHSICWGWRQGERFFTRGHKVLVMERGYIGDRFHYTSLGWNGLNNYATFPEYPDDGGARFRAHGGVIKPWKKDGDYALILGQVPTDKSLQGRDIKAWYLEQIDLIRAKYNIAIHFRPHPESIKRGVAWDLPNTKRSQGSLQDALSKAAFTVAFNSNSCVDSILAGVPCIAGDKGTMAWDLCGKSIDEIIYPEREKIVHQIAWKQWSPEEISQGTPFKRLFICG
jgi:hypothetical protein